MAGGLGEFIYNTDKAIFNWLQHTWLAEWLGDASVLLGNVYFWTPFFIFLFALLVQSRTKSGGWNIFFALGTVVVAYQASVLLSSVLRHPPPYYFAALEGIRLPAFQVDASYSLPDWSMTCFFGLFAFVKNRMRRYSKPLPNIFWLAPILFFLFRLLPGYSFPIDLITSVILGHFIAFLMGKMSEGVEVILEGEEPNI